MKIWNMTTADCILFIYLFIFRKKYLPVGWRLYPSDSSHFLYVKLVRLHLSLNAPQKKKRRAKKTTKRKKTQCFKMHLVRYLKFYFYSNGIWIFFIYSSLFTFLLSYFFIKKYIELTGTRDRWKFMIFKSIFFVIHLFGVCRATMHWARQDSLFVDCFVSDRSWENLAHVPRRARQCARLL